MQVGSADFRRFRICPIRVGMEYFGQVLGDPDDVGISTHIRLQIIDYQALRVGQMNCAVDGAPPIPTAPCCATA